MIRKTCDYWVSYSYVVVCSRSRVHTCTRLLINPITQILVKHFAPNCSRKRPWLNNFDPDCRTTFCFVRPIKTLYVCTLLTSTHAICATNTPTIHVHRTVAIQKETTLQFRRTHLELPAHSSRTPTPTDKRSCSLTPDPGPRCAPEDSTVTQRKQSQQNYKTR